MSAEDDPPPNEGNRTTPTVNREGETSCATSLINRLEVLVLYARAFLLLGAANYVALSRLSLHDHNVAKYLPCRLPATRWAPFRPRVQ